MKADLCSSFFGLLFFSLPIVQQAQNLDSKDTAIVNLMEGKSVSEAEGVLVFVLVSGEIHMSKDK